MLNVAIELPTGVVAQTWAPIDTKFNHRTGEARVLVGCWLNQDAYMTGKQPLEAPREWVFSAAEISAATNGVDINFTALVLALMASLPVFSPPPEPAP